MEITCEIIREKLAVCINDRVDPKEDSVLLEHLEQCEECNRYYNELKADDLELSEFADSMLPIITRIETNINKEIENTKVGSTPFLKNKLLKIAVAAMILAGVTITLNYFGIISNGAGTAWAKVSQIILNTKTITFNVVIGDGPPVTCIATEKILKQKLSSGVEAIFDYDNKKILVLDPNNKTSMNIDLAGLPILPSNLFVNFKTTIELLKEYPGTVVTRLEKRTINNKEVEGIQVSLDQNIDLKIWYDTKNKFPVLVIAEKMIGQTNVTFSDFNLDIFVDEPVFNPNIPEDYTELGSVKMNLKNLTEQDLIEGLKVWAGLMEERFPEKLDLAIIQEHAEDIERLLNEQGMSDIDKSLIVIKIMRALMFVNQLAVDWHYNGNNVSLDDTNTPIFWYRPVNTEMYRVIYRDLHIENVPLENLPERP